jgi:hypothetical protein
MLNPNTRLTIKYSDNGSFTDYSNDLQDFTRDTVSFVLKTSIDALYIGYYKPINKIYFDMNEINSNNNTLTVKYYNGSSFISVDGKIDETKGLTRSGFIHWTREQSDQAQTTIDSVGLYWYEITTDTTHSDSIYNGIGLIFADDKDLSEIVPEINDSSHLAGKASHILAHISTKKWIIQDLRNRNYGKRDIDGLFQEITAWDLLDIDQINQAAIYKALSIIFFNYSDEVGDKYEQKSKSYNKTYSEFLDLAKLRLDLDDDGVLDETENAKEFTTRRVRR